MRKDRRASPSEVELEGVCGCTPVADLGFAPPGAAGSPDPARRAPAPTPLQRHPALAAPGPGARPEHPLQPLSNGTPHEPTLRADWAAREAASESAIVTPQRARTVLGVGVARSLPPKWAPTTTSMPQLVRKEGAPSPPAKGYSPPGDHGAPSVHGDQMEAAVEREPQEARRSATTHKCGAASGAPPHHRPLMAGIEPSGVPGSVADPQQSPLSKRRDRRAYPSGMAISAMALPVSRAGSSPTSVRMDVTPMRVRKPSASSIVLHRRVWVVALAFAQDGRGRQLAGPDGAALIPCHGLGLAHPVAGLLLQTKGRLIGSVRDPFNRLQCQRRSRVRIRVLGRKRSLPRLPLRILQGRPWAIRGREEADRRAA